ncbi:MAG: Clp protease ClpP [Bacteroidetes bacterium]|nr:Clp protease ClpP [Bacteroidota bacterium]
MFKPLQITNQAGTLRIRITGYLGEEVTEASVTRQLDALPQAERIEVYINSGGGSVPVGNAIAVALRQHPAPKTAYVVGACASMATLIALSCDRVVMDALAEWMVHLPITTATGRSDQLRDAAQISEELEQQFVQLYTARTGMSAEDMLQLLREEKWLSASRAHELGFVDEVLQLQMAAFYPTEERPAPQRLAALLPRATDARAGWDYLQWARQDPQGLARLKAQEPERFRALLDRVKA